MILACSFTYTFDRIILKRPIDKHIVKNIGMFNI